MTIVADDYGIGPETSHGILDLASEGRISAAVLLVNCEDSERAARAWQAASPDADLGWHPNLTLDRPISDPARVPTLVREDGSFWPLSGFLRRVCLRRINVADVRTEWRAQYQRFIDLVGDRPPVVNSHQHASLFSPCDRALFDVLGKDRPYLRRVVERVDVLARVPGARIKRSLLTILGLQNARRALKRGLPGCDWLVGVTDHGCVANDRFLSRWIARLPSSGSVEICCHPGYVDETLVGRDCDAGDGLIRRPRETAILRTSDFRAACAAFSLVKPSMLSGVPDRSTVSCC